MRIELKKFVWDSKNRVLRADISDLQLKGLPRKLIVFNPDTNKERTFDYIGVSLSDEDEVEGWRYTNFNPGNVKENIALWINND